MKFVRKLPKVEELRRKLPITQEEYDNKEKYIKQIENVIKGKDKRKLIIIGPCSADREDAVLEYAVRLSKVASDVRQKLILIPRLYTSKPRTTGEGYKGMLHNPKGNEREDLLEGLIAARKLHINVIRETGFYGADEMLYPEEINYISDLLCYMTVGARSVEDQSHRMLASDSGIPVGMKNPTGGSKIVLMNSVKAAQNSHKMIYHGWEVETEGNHYAHSIMRGFTNKNNKSYSNYHYEDMIEMYDLCMKYNIKNPSVIIDCNHANSDKHYDEEPRIAKDVFRNCLINENVNSLVKGLMIESYLEDGVQLVGNNIFGKSITDPCLGWDKTEKLLYELTEMLP